MSRFPVYRLWLMAAVAVAVTLALMIGTVRWYRALGPVTNIPFPSDRMRQFGEDADNAAFLDRRLPDPLLLTGELKSGLQQLSDLAGVAITAEWRTLEKAGSIRPETPITTDLSGLTLGDGLLRLRDSLGPGSSLHWHLGPADTVRLSAMSPAAMQPMTMIFDLTDLIAPSEHAPFADLAELAQQASQRIPSLGTFESNEQQTERPTTTVADGLLTRRLPSGPPSPARLGTLRTGGRTLLVVTSDHVSLIDFEIHLDTLRYRRRMWTILPAALKWAGWSLLWTLPAALLLALPLAERAFRRALAHIGCCPVCGYDLRASPDRCPECGNPSPTAVQST